MRLPEVQDELRLLAGEIGRTTGRVDWAIRLTGLADAMARRPRVTQARPSADRMTPEKRARIWALHERHPGWTHPQISRELNVHPGRVSETLAGKRT